MTVEEKYKSVKDKITSLNAKDVKTMVDSGVYKIWATVETPHEKNMVWDVINEVGGIRPTDFQADIKVANESILHKHTVEKGETLGKIAKEYYKDASKYMTIFNANKNILKDPDLIQIGQELIIPNL